MIPKVIHYIWFGGKPLTPLADKCINSWKVFCPEYKIVRWDESNFDINANLYCREAYDTQKWAFASDYARLWVLVNYGGIYMDTDVELLKPLDEFLGEQAFSGFEAADRIPTGLMASEANHPLFRELLSEYDSRTFVLPDGSLDTRTNVESITRKCLMHGLRLNNQKQKVAGFTLYPSEFFCPKDSKTLELNLTCNSAAIHHFDGSWLSDSTKKVKAIKQSILKKSPRIPSWICGPLANMMYLLNTGDFAHLRRLIASKADRYYRG